MVVVSGTGLLDPRASFGGPDTDRAHLFTICDDATAGDALSLSEVGPMFRKAVDASARDRIDILAFDLRELQCLEVAYELEGIVDVLIAPQTRVPDSGWNFEVVLAECDAVLGQAAAVAAGESGGPGQAARADRGRRLRSHTARATCRCRRSTSRP